MEECSTTPKNVKNTKKEKSESFVKKGEEVTPYFLYYTRSETTVNVSKDVFRKLKATVIDFRSFKLKVIGDHTRKQVQDRFKGFRAQGLSELVSMFSTILSKINTVITVANDTASKINKRFCILMAKLVLEMSAFSSDFAGKRIDQFINIILSVYSLIDHFSAQGLEGIVLAGLYPYFPECLQSLLKHLNLFTSVKVADDFTLIHTLFEKLETFLTYILTQMGANDSLINLVVRCFSYLGFGEKHLLLNQMDKARETALKNPRELMKKEFCDFCVKLNDKYCSNNGINDWKRRCGSVKEECEKWDRFMKIINANLDSSRQEPNLFVFQGQPGVGKSIFLNQVVSSLGWSCYSHIVPDVNEGRDFYDSYNNEDVFYMDDVGQKGVSQWRTMINMVSSVKLPLDCAEAKLKDTKFFNSHSILVTTNAFTNINSIMRTDGIADVRALWRRGMVFDFEECKRNEGHFSGFIRFKYYDLKDNSFKNGFPSYFKYEISPNFKFNNETTDLHSARVWMGAIIKGFKEIKDEMKKSYDLTQSMKEQTQSDIDDLLRFFTPEVEKIKAQGDGGFNWSTMKMGAGLYIGGLMASRVCNLLYSEFNDFCYVVDTELLAQNDPNIKYIRDRKYAQLQNHFDRFIMGSMVVALSYVAYLAVSYLYGKYNGKDDSVTSKLVGNLKGEGVKLLGDFSSVHNSVKLIKDHVFECSLKTEVAEVACCCLVSGRLIILPEHMNLDSNMSIKIYKDKERNHVLLDWITISVVYSNTEEDVCVFELPQRYPNPFKSLYNWLDKNSDIKEDEFLITPWGYQSVKAADRIGMVADYNFRVGKMERILKTKENYFMYDHQASGMCGSPIFSVKKGILGFHVAGSDNSGIGIGSCWSSEVIKVLKNLMLQDKPLVSLPFSISERILENSSVCKLDNPLLVSNTPSVSNIEPTQLYGIYPVDRYPAELSKYGSKTLKVVSQKSFKNCVSLAPGEVDFARKVLEEMIAPFSELTNQQVIEGTELLAGLNSKSSNGFGCFKDKEIYIDFEGKKCTPLFEEQLNQICVQAQQGEIDYKHFVWFECLKDEIRNEEKEGVPRSFRVGTIHQQFLMKKIFGNMVENIMRDRNFNKIMVGCNPIKEWPIIYNDLLSGDVFAGDIKNWDGGMNPVIQELIADVLFKRSLCKNKNLVQALLGTLTNSIVLVDRDLYITTHSMPSGSYLTAIVNSLVNKLYTAVWYFRNVPNPTTLGYWTDVSDYVYGDDKLNVVRKHHDKLNALTMEAFFESVGLGFTDACKHKIVEPFQDISEVSFLKRTFRYHYQLKKIVCPLELRVIQNTLSFYDGTKDMRTVLKDKIHAVQREMYLHSDWNNLLSDLYGRLGKFNVDYVKLPPEVLKTYFLDDNCDVQLSFSSNNLYF